MPCDGDAVDKSGEILIGAVQRKDADEHAEVRLVPAVGIEDGAEISEAHARKLLRLIGIELGIKDEPVKQSMDIGKPRCILRIMGALVFKIIRGIEIKKRLGIIGMLEQGGKAVEMLVCNGNAFIIAAVVKHLGVEVIVHAVDDYFTGACGLQYLIDDLGGFDPCVNALKALPLLGRIIGIDCRHEVGILMLALKVPLGNGEVVAHAFGAVLIGFDLFHVAEIDIARTIAVLGIVPPQKYGRQYERKHEYGKADRYDDNGFLFHGLSSAERSCSAKAPPMKQLYSLHAKKAITRKAKPESPRQTGFPAPMKTYLSHSSGGRVSRPLCSGSAEVAVS